MEMMKPPEAPSSPVDIPPAYLEAIEGATVLRRRDRRFLSVGGLDPKAMLTGILSGRIPDPLNEAGDGWEEGVAPYSTVLTPKGRMVTDLRLIPTSGSGFFLDLPEVALEAGLGHFRKYLNPRFAKLSDLSASFGMLSVVGPEGPGRVSEVLGFEVANPGSDGVRYRAGGSGQELWLLGNGDIGPPAFDLVLPLPILEQVRGQMEEEGIRSLDQASWEVLRVEAGTPLFGVDMTDETIPVEAGIHRRAIDYEKGCYTGQEVIIRLRDRGQVNKHLRRILLGDVEVPEAGTELFAPPGEPEGEKVGWITSACQSPRFGQTIALGFVKRRVGLGGEVRLGGPQGPSGEVTPLLQEKV